MYLLTEVAERERQANQSRLTSLGTWAVSIALVCLALSPLARNNRPIKSIFLLGAAALTAASQASARNLATHDRVVQDYRDISDNQRQQLAYEVLSPKRLIKQIEAEEEEEPLTEPPTHNISRTIASVLKSTVVLGAPRSGKGYAIAHGLEQLPDNVNLWLIDPKDDRNEAYYWRRVPLNQRVLSLFNRFLQAPSSPARPKLLIVDECSPGLAKGMTAVAYRAFMGRLSTISSVGPSKGNFVWLMAQSSTVEDLAMTSGNKASFRVVATGHATQTEGSWYRSLKRSMGIETPAAELTGYIQLIDGEWGWSEPFQLTQSESAVDEQFYQSAELAPEQEALKAFLTKHSTESFTLRELTGKSFAKRLSLRSMDTMGQLVASLMSMGFVTVSPEGRYRLAESESQS